MGTKTFGWRTPALHIFVVCLLLAAAFFTWGVYQTYKDRERAVTLPILQCLLGAVLLIIGVFGNTINPTPVWLRIITPTCVHYSLLVSYFVHQRVFNDKKINIFRTKLFIATTLLSLIAVTLDILNGDNATSFINDEPFKPTLLYYAHYCIRSLISLYIELSTVVVIRKNLWKHRDRTIVFRKFMDLLAFISFAGSSYFVEIGLFLTLFNGDLYRRLFNDLFFGSMLSGGFWMLLSVLPNTLLKRIVGTSRAHKLKEAKRYLHPKYVQVIPGPQYRFQELQEERIDIELEHAHFMLWTHAPRTRPVSPEDEARLLFYCLQKTIVFHVAGPCDPCPTRDDIDTHFLNVAKELKRLEKSPASASTSGVQAIRQERNLF